MGGRRRKNIDLREGIYIVGEGITEQYYFKHLKHIKKYRCIVKPRFFGKTDIIQIVKTVEDLLKGGVAVICVFDADVSCRNVAERKKLNEFKKKYIKKKDVFICDSLPSIEFWFLLHYLKSFKVFPNYKFLEKELKKHISNYSKTDSFLKNSKWVGDMTSNIGNACNLAEQNCSSQLSYSKIYIAIDKLERTIRKKL